MSVIRTPNSSSTRNSINASLPDTLAYIFNFGEANGFTILAADRRVEEKVLAFVEHGSYSENSDNPGFNFFMELAEDYLQSQIIEAELMRDSLEGVMLDYFSAEPDQLYGDDTGSSLAPSGGRYSPPINRTKTTVEDFLVQDWHNTGLKNPLLPVEWGQGAPFNEAVKTKGGYTNSPTGCVATAIAQIMAYHRYPAYRYNWEEMNKYTGYYSFYENEYPYKTWDKWIGGAPQSVQDDVAKLMLVIGDKVGMKYKEHLSSAKSGDAANVFRGQGYSNPSSLQGYNYNTAFESIAAGLPVYMSGKSDRKGLLGIYYEYGGGHAWVADGYMIRRRIMGRKIIKTRGGKVVSEKITYQEEYIYFLHTNWGWEGEDNGYYASGCFNRHDPQYPSNMTRDVSGSGGNYKYELKMIPYIHP